MKEPTTKYTFKSKNTPILIEFQYDLDGRLRAFEIVEGELTNEQFKFLFDASRFPHTESRVEVWKVKVTSMEITKGEPDLSFNTFWNLYNYKVGKKATEMQWKKLKPLDRINAIKAISSYEGYLKRTHIAKVYPERFLRNRRFEDQFNSY